MRLPADQLRRGFTAVLEAAGAHPVVAADIAHALVTSSLRGIDSHGVNLLPRILSRVEAGRSQLIRPAADVSPRPGLPVAVLDADLAPGQHAGLAAARLAVDRARQFGIGLVCVRNSTHFGSCAPYVLEVVEAGMAAFVGSNSTMSMAAFDAPFVNLGNNPLGIGAPVDGGPDLVVDFSCGVMSFGRLNKLKAAGQPVPEDAFVRPQLRPGGDPIYEVAGSLEWAALPFGGYKGASIALLVELLSGVLGGGHFGADTETIKDGRFQGPSHFVLAVDPGPLLGDRAVLAARMRSYVDAITDGDPSVRVPGMNAAAIADERGGQGVPVAADLIDGLAALCGKYDCDRHWLESGD